MKVIFRLVLVCALVLFATASFAANVLTHEAAQVEIAIPANWTQSADGDVMTIESPDKEMAVVFMILNPKTADKALEELDATLEKTIGEITWNDEGAAKTEEINGMSCDVWVGVAEKSKVQVECISLDTPSGKKLGIYWLDTPESEKKFAADIETIMQGLKPVAAAPATPVAAPADDAGDTEDAGADTEGE